MKIFPSNHKKSTDLPLKLKISFEAVFDYLKEISANKNHYLYNTAIQLIEEYKNYPELKDGFEDLSYLEKYNKEIDKLLDILFPELLQSNEIKAASIPFEFTMFKLSKRFEQILKNAGDNYELKLRNYDESNLYIMTCTFILAHCYDHYIDFRRPFFFDIPNINSGITKHYRTLFNGDFFNVKPLDNAPEISKEDVHTLLDNFTNLELWKEKFPPNSYEFKGFGIVNLFDVSSDESLSALKENLLKKDEESVFELEKIISNLFGSTSIKFGFSTYGISKGDVALKLHKTQKSYIAPDIPELNCNEFFCNGIITKVFKNMDLIAISDVEKYGNHTNFNGFYKALARQKIKSIILVPLQLSDEVFGVMELVSEKKRELNSINANKLKDVIPVFKIAAQRFMEEFENSLESVIQEHYTSLHPTVKWRFYEEAEKYLYNLESDNRTPNLKNIVFENVVPLYGQSDIKGSSIARNTAIQKDLVKQLHFAAKIIKKAEKLYNLPVYGDLFFRINECLHEIKKGLNSGDEVSLTDFLNKDIYPVFNHLKTLDNSLKNDIDNYMGLLDDKLLVIYDKRKKYEDSVNTLNEELAKFIDEKQVEAQNMFPHYFERYKTDGIDYNMYIGQSLVRNFKFDKIYLYNLRLWQLQMMCEVENIARGLKKTLKHPLDVASLILVHSNPLSIKFRMDEKKFDVDGAYNIRYEIIKKRIDKALIKNTDERLTQPGKIAIVYSQDKDASEYLNYIKYLQSKNYLLEPVEHLKLEDLQGISGLKALRVDVNYNILSENNITLEDIMKVVNDENLN
jgi:hypothetical protein